MSPANKGKGAAIQWLKDRAAYSGDKCLIWPFSTTRGYGRFGHNGKGHYAHRYMCALMHGNAPTPDHQAAHSCGNGHKGCVHPQHLSWKTQSENQLDRRQHGTTRRNIRGRPGSLTLAQVEQIRALASTKTQDEIAAMFDTVRGNVQLILAGKTKTRVYGLERQRVLTTLAKATRPMTTNEITESARLVSKVAARSMLKLMSRAGIIKKVSPGLYVSASQPPP